MKRLLERWRRRVAIAVLGVGLLMAPALDQNVRAQQEEPAAEPGAGSGRSLDGYLGTIVLVLLVFFVVGKSARR